MIFWCSIPSCQNNGWHLMTLLICGWYLDVLFPQGETIDDIPQAVIDDCAQLVKANSIQGITSGFVSAFVLVLGELFVVCPGFLFLSVLSPWQTYVTNIRDSHCFVLSFVPPVMVLSHNSVFQSLVFPTFFFFLNALFWNTLDHSVVAWCCSRLNTTYGAHMIKFCVNFEFEFVM